MDPVSLGAFLLSAAIAIVVAFPLGKALRAHSGVFYAVAAASVALFCWATFAKVNLNDYRLFTFILQKGYLSSVLLGLVMFVGCFDDANPFRRRLMPIRGELSVLSFIFVMGHVIIFLPSYATRFFAGTNLKANVVASIAVALVLGVIFVVLGVTSFKTVRRSMNSKVWKGIQRFSYAMVALYIVHIGFFLSTSALGGSGKGLVSFVVYLVAVVSYAVLRLAKAVRDRTRRSA